MYDVDAVGSIFAAKKRPFFDPLIVHTDSLQKASVLVDHFPPLAVLLAESFWPGPLTLLLPKRGEIPDLVTAGSPLVGIRMPNHPLTLRLLRALPFPLAAPSANPFGYVSPTTARHVADQLGDRVSYVLDGGACSVGIESTIVSFEAERPVIRRLGGVTRAALQRVVGPVDRYLHQAPNKPCLPGTLFAHYAPRKKIRVAERATWLSHCGDANRVGILAFRTPAPAFPADRQIVLSPTGCLEAAARTLFHGLRLLDGMDIDLILAEYVPNHGLGEAINDRLRRAQAAQPPG